MSDIRRDSYLSLKKLLVLSAAGIPSHHSIIDIYQRHIYDNVTVIIVSS